ncbi:A-kinase anchor protein 2-like isoform X2 [Protopterus annectens]|nr:A-kinase anchor protein 2-like isoform X2 [Protopterus annectens]
MEIEMPLCDSQDTKLMTLTDAEDNHGDYFSVVSSHDGLKSRNESLDSDVANEIRYLDEVLEESGRDSGLENNINGSSSPEPSTITVDGSSPSVSVSDDVTTTDEIVIATSETYTSFRETHGSEEDNQQLSSSDLSEMLTEEPYRYISTPESPRSSASSRRSSKDGEMPLITIKKEAKFELRAFHEDKKPAKLFDDDGKKEVRVRKIRPSEEVIELERERRELIKSQAVKKNPGITSKWWNPPKEKSIEEELDEQNLESHRKYKERKQKQRELGGVPVTPSEPKETAYTCETQEPVNMKKDDIVTEQIDFSAARKQFLQIENSSQSNNSAAQRRSITPKLFSAKPFLKASDTLKGDRSVASVLDSTVVMQSEPNEVTVVKAERVACISDDHQASQEGVTSDQVNELSYITVENLKQQQSPTSCMHDDDFTSATAVFTVLKEDDHDISEHLTKPIHVSFHTEELDSGLDELSLRSQDTAVLETLSNDFSMDNISDSGASNDTMNAFHDSSLGDFSQPQTPHTDVSSDHGIDGMSKSFSDHGFYPFHSVSPERDLSDEQLEYHAGILVQNAIKQAIAEQTGTDDSDNHEYLQELKNSEEQKEQSRALSPVAKQSSPFEPPQVSSPVQETRDVIPKTSVERSLELEAMGRERHTSPVPDAIQSSPTESPKQEFSYFSKYSEAAELRSTASVIAAQETEVAMGPFRLRSKKQRTLSMIEEEIRAAQEREEELKKQRQNLQTVQSPVRKNAMSLPSRTVCHTKTAPGKIEKVRTPSGESSALQAESLFEDASGNQRPKTLMQTLMQDYESHKMKRRDTLDDNSYTHKLISQKVTSEVLEATRVGRRKSAMALKWEAGIYANREDDE